MALNIKSPEADRLARELAAMTGESITEAVTRALDERIARCRPSDEDRVRRELARIRAAVQRLPILDDRPMDEILGYNEYGTFD